MKQSKLRFLLTYLLGVSLITLVGCYEPTEGCVEPWAVNYDVLADDLCEDCCTPPEVRVKIQYLTPDSSTYRFGDTLRLEDNSYVTLHSVNVMLSNFEMESSGVQVVSVNDSITLDEVDYESDFGFSRGQGSGISLTQYREPYSVDAISFVQGVPSVWQDTSIFGADNVIIAEAIDSLYRADMDKFALFSCTISTDTINQDTVKYVSTLLNTADYNLVIPGGYPLSLGDNTTINMKIYLTEWLEGVTLDGTNTEAVADQLSALPYKIEVE